MPILDVEKKNEDKKASAVSFSPSWFRLWPCPVSAPESRMKMKVEGEKQEAEGKFWPCPYWQVERYLSSLFHVDPELVVWRKLGDGGCRDTRADWMHAMGR